MVSDRYDPDRPPFDPDQALTELRRWWTGAVTSSLTPHTAGWTMRALDRHISAGGQLPAAWLSVWQSETLAQLAAAREHVTTDHAVLAALFRLHAPDGLGHACSYDGRAFPCRERRMLAGDEPAEEATPGAPA